LIPIYDIEDDAKEIVKGLAMYMAVVYPEQSMLNALKLKVKNLSRPNVFHAAAPAPKVEFFSTFVKVGNRAMSWDAYRASQAPKVHVTERVTVPGTPDLGGLSSLLGSLLNR